MKDPDGLRQALRQAGLSSAAIDAAWPSWWSEDAKQSRSANAELRFTLARKLGLEPRSLTGDRVRFVWPDRTRFKHLSAESPIEVDALSSFSVAVGKLLLQGIDPIVAWPLPIAAMEVRRAILSTQNWVDLASLVATCWGLGIPVIHLRVFPLEAKSMHAMVVNVSGRPAILLGRDAKYPAPIAFTLAHEMGHIFHGHLSAESALVDLEDPAISDPVDDEELAADEYALELLTGDKHLKIAIDGERFGSRSLASAVLKVGPRERIDPGTLALCVGYQTKNWGAANGSLKYIYARDGEVWSYVNRVAEQQLDWETYSEEAAEYLRLLMGI